MLHSALWCCASGLERIQHSVHSKSLALKCTEHSVLSKERALSTQCPSPSRHSVLSASIVCGPANSVRNAFRKQAGWAKLQKVRATAATHWTARVWYRHYQRWLQASKEGAEASKSGSFKDEREWARNALRIWIRERECCLLVLNLVSSTLSCIRQPRPRLRVLDVCGFV